MQVDKNALFTCKMYKMLASITIFCNIQYMTCSKLSFKKLFFCYACGSTVLYICLYVILGFWNKILMILMIVSMFIMSIVIIMVMMTMVMIVRMKSSVS